jgi:CubicO group peptidase (beta-lactamase class C family)
MKPLQKQLILIFTWAIITALIFVMEAVVMKPDMQGGDIASLQKYLVTKLSEAANNQRFGCASLVLLHDGQIYGEYGFGITNSVVGKPPGPDKSLFLLSSVSKQVTSWGILKLYQEGMIDLDEPIQPLLKRWQFPDGEDFAKKVTTRHLLSHTAGIVDGFGYSGFGPTDTVQTLEEALRYPGDANNGIAHDTRVVFEPGTKMSYSSAGYLVLQLLVEEVSHMPFNEYMKKEIFEPLGMVNTDYDISQIISNGHENDLVANYDENLKSHPHRRYANLAGVSLRITTHDLALLLKSYVTSNPVLHDSLIYEMAFPQPGTFGSWGLGHEIYSLEDSFRIIGHGGGAFPRTGASCRINLTSRNGIALLMTGGTEMIDPYINEWMYWETGKKPMDVRMVLHQRKWHALILFLSGSALLIYFVKRGFWNS